MVLAVDPDNEYPLTLRSPHCIPKTCKVSHSTKVKKGDELVNQPGMWHPIKWFKLIKFQITNVGNALITQTNCLSGIIQDNLASALGKARLEGFAPVEILNDNF